MRLQCDLCDLWANSRSRIRKEELWEVHEGVSIPYTPVRIFVCSTCRSKGPPDELRCEANNIAGNRCGHWSLHDSNHCIQHKEGES